MKVNCMRPWLKLNPVIFSDQARIDCLLAYAGNQAAGQVVGIVIVC